MSPLEFPSEAAWRFWRMKRAFGVVRMALLGIFAGLVVQLLGLHIPGL